MVDWYPTLLKLAGAKLEQKLPLDGLDVVADDRGGQAVAAQGDPASTRRRNGGAVRVGDWKLVVNGGRQNGDEPAPKKKAGAERSSYSTWPTTCPRRRTSRPSTRTR